jgi:uncharacterized protein YbbC (DUF1343 family)
MSRVETGLDRWLQGKVEPVPPDARIGLVVHPASVDSRACPAPIALQQAGLARLERLFAPEHGVYGHQQDMEPVHSSGAPGSGPPVSSLYGDSLESLRPRVEDLAGLDAVVYDLQDVGSRYYTYVYTLSYLMEAAREAGVRVVVLDRPNPLGGLALEGPVLDPACASFVGRFPLPVRHGMTTGELARMFRDAFELECDLDVVEMRGWRRSMCFEDTGLPWVPPSPNMPTPTTARVYPGACLIEGTNLSEGRGTTTPFELVGAPWCDGVRLAASLADLALDGVLFRPASFRPMFQKHAGCECSGVQVLIEDRQSFRPFATYLALIAETRRQAPDAFAWRREPYEFETERLAIDLLLGRTDLRPLLESGASLDVLERSWSDGLESFGDSRRSFLIYE